MPTELLIYIYISEILFIYIKRVLIQSVIDCIILSATAANRLRLSIISKNF